MRPVPSDPLVIQTISSMRNLSTQKNVTDIMDRYGAPQARRDAGVSTAWFRGMVSSSSCSPSPRVTECQYHTTFWTRNFLDCKVGSEILFRQLLSTGLPWHLKTRQSASAGDGGLDGNISFNDFETSFQVDQHGPEEDIDDIDEVEEEEQELDRLSSRWLQRHTPEHSYRSVCVTGIADVQGMFQPQMQGRFQAFKSRLDDAASSRVVFQVANHEHTGGSPLLGFLL
jgi:hypothetical protein